MRRFYKAIFLVIELLSCYLLVSGFLPFECVFQKYLGIACPACGFTRAFREIFQFHIIESLQYNLLSIFMFLLVVIVDVYLIIDIMFGTQKIERFWGKLGKHTTLILVILLINMVINNIKGM